MKKISLRISSISFGVALALILLELLLRIFSANSAAWTRPDDVLGYSFIPNADYKFQPPEGCPGWGSEGAINSKGLRDFEHDYTKSAATFRILAIGDSFTEAMQFPLENTWTKLLEKQLNERGEQWRYEVINAGVGGYGTAQEYLFYTYEGYRYEPDLVILMFYSNDIHDVSKALNPQAQSLPFYSIIENELVLDNSFTQSRTYKLKTALEYLKPKSYLVSFLARTYNQVSRINNERNIVARNTESSGETNELGWERVETEKAVEVTKRLLVELNEAIAANGGRMILLNIDENVTVSPDVPGKMLDEVAQSQGIRYFDLFPVLVPGAVKSSQSSGDYMFGCAENQGEGHLSEAGNVQTARLIYEYLVAEKLLPQKP